MSNENDLERRKNDCLARLGPAAAELNKLLKEAASLGIDREVVVVPHDDTVTSYDFSKNADWNAWLPVTTVGDKYPEVLVLKPGQFVPPKA